MFEDSLVESVGRIRTRSHRYVAGSFLLEAMLIAILIVLPWIYPAALPQKFLTVPLIAPPHAPAPQMEQQRSAASPVAHPEMLERTLTAPSRIPTTITHIVDAAPPGDAIGSGMTGGPGTAPPGAIFGNGTPPPAPPVHLARPSGPVRISAGVAAGQLLAPIRPVYPPIALATRTQGTVEVAATISPQGTIENLKVVSGSAMLVPAAVDAIRRARYRPWMLSGQPVEVETTIDVVFTLEPH